MINDAVMRLDQSVIYSQGHRPAAREVNQIAPRTQIVVNPNSSSVEQCKIFVFGHLVS